MSFRRMRPSYLARQSVASGSGHRGGCLVLLSVASGSGHRGGWLSSPPKPWRCQSTRLVKSSRPRKAARAARAVSASRLRYSKGRKNLRSQGIASTTEAMEWIDRLSCRNSTSSRHSRGCQNRATADDHLFYHPHKDQRHERHDTHESTGSLVSTRNLAPWWRCAKAAAVLTPTSSPSMASSRAQPRPQGKEFWPPAFVTPVTARGMASMA
mmetsp:Transcript_30707/g.98960  ORF Transcript_30707/g.98960 Transcript_30707/m.98960 type:complete len:211 (-) Transcript_30707:155-787(-)